MKFLALILFAFVTHADQPIWIMDSIEVDLFNQPKALARYAHAIQSELAALNVTQEKDIATRIHQPEFWDHVVRQTNRTCRANRSAACQRLREAREKAFDSIASR